MNRILAAGCVALALTATACPGPLLPTERPSARGWVLLVAEGVRVADVTCAEVAKARKSIETADACARGYSIARNALIAAEAGLDAKDGKGWACPLRDALASLSAVAMAIHEAGGSLPAVVADALTLGQALAEAQCRKVGAR